MRIVLAFFVVDTTMSGDGWTLRIAQGWMVREGAKKGDYELVKQP